MAFTFNITNGICFGVVTHMLLTLVNNIQNRHRPDKQERLPWVLVGTSAVMAARFIWLND
jgi:xanthine/uracil/vitamin C permease (AzgA family)